MNQVQNGSMDQQRVASLDTRSGQQEEGPGATEAGVTSDTTIEDEDGNIGGEYHNGTKPRHDEEPREPEEEQQGKNADRSDQTKHQENEQGPRQRRSDRSPPKKRFRGDLPEVVRVSSSTLPTAPFVDKSSVVLTESSLESPAEPRLDDDEDDMSDKGRAMLTLRAQDPNSPKGTNGAYAHTPHPQSPSSSVTSIQQQHSSGSLAYTSPSSHVSDASPLPPPPAPPSTPASVPPTFQDVATPRPGLEGTASDYDLPFRQQQQQHGVMENARALEQKHAAEVAQQAVTPAPTVGRKKAGPTLVEDFSEWAVGDRYELLRILGRGSYGEVAQARDLHHCSKNRNDAFVAIKRITSAFEQEVDAVRLYREMHILRRLRGHDCIIQLLDVVQPPTDDLDDFHDLYLVFEYVDTDLYKLIMSPQFLTTEHIQTFLYQMLAGLKYIHSSSVIHRDLKPANILLNEDCSLKICDFGLARIVNPSTMVSTATTGDEDTKEGQSAETATASAIDTPISFGSPPKSRLTRQLTKHVVTRWYRAPELILIQPYTSAVDIWSLGCILAELLSMQEGNLPGYEDRQPLFPGGSCYPLSGEGASIKKDERLDQLSVIFGVIGTPDPEDLASIGKVTEYIESLEKQKGKPFETLFPAADPAALDLLKNMLKFNPKKRCTAEEALEHEFLKGVRRKEMEKGAEQPLVGPDFLETTKIDLKTLKRRTYEEVLCYKHQGSKSE